MATTTVYTSRPSKRRRVDSEDLITPPTTDLEPLFQHKNDTVPDIPTCSILHRAIHVLKTEAAALANLSHLYETSENARQGLQQAVQAILMAQATSGRVIVCGVGKSGYIAQKLTATCKSLGIPASFMHACEAVHGDLGDVRGGKDILVFVSYSGRTPELLNLIPHIPAETKVIAVSSHLRPEDCSLLEAFENSILLPAPVPEREEVSFGVAAPTTSTTVALAVADMLALTVAEQMHGKRTGEVFARNHPGGAIGLSERAMKKRRKRGEKVATLVLPSPEVSASDDG